MKRTIEWNGEQFVLVALPPCGYFGCEHVAIYDGLPIDGLMLCEYHKAEFDMLPRTVRLVDWWTRAQGGTERAFRRMSHAGSSTQSDTNQAD